ncbi:NAD-dependent epimerase/dehydratase family protein [Erythrobacter sp.]|uniref:NAD-dependent epimerase/dehydratase family protein n=1 Tax=Erythrobacter sp. TaxID=1042 RepID=UPI001B01DA47|nr:NAD-dependent epimerase/dehydratase family protein [Erythrobacter sp.]MBO6525910.1 NAD-dependent epimerase/dehydratase family protein [Erythrobacter sp.]MBO6529415.1 NAD-dependent epimerase/dehydratase family protein [Erythrobacter sp.]
MVKSILVTGGTGYIGGEVIDQLLAGGYTVHTTVRNKAKSEPKLRARWPEAGERLKVFQADLMSDEGWAEANAGCDAVAHVASPFPMATPKDKDDLVIPAREGTLRALKFAHEAGIERFVQTSSAAAIAYGQPDKDHFTHLDWTNLAAGVPPYIESKTVAERAARDWVATHAPTMTFCSINPVAVFGPVYDDDMSTSVKMVKKIIDGSIPLIPDMGICVTDVRDVAEAHVRAIEAPAEKVRGERFPTSQKFMWIREMAETVRSRAPEHARKVPKKPMPDWLVKLLAPFMDEMKQIRSELGNVRDVSGKHTEEVLGFTFIPAEQTLEDTVRSLVRKGIVKV